MTKHLILAAACFAAFVSTGQASAHDIYKSGSLTINAGGIFDAGIATRIQNSKYYTQDFPKEKNNNGDITGWTGPIKRGITKNNENVAIYTAAGAYLGASNKASNGMVYGVNIGLATNTKTGYLPLKEDMARTYGYLEHDKWGRFEIGTKKGVSKTMRIDADQIAAATGGIDGGWSAYLNLKSFKGPEFKEQVIDDDNFTDGPKLIYKDNDKDANHEGNRKITYYTPRFSNGIQFGISYVPDSGNKGGETDPNKLQTFANNEPSNRRLRDLITVALSWLHKINDKSSITVELDAETAKLTENIKKVSKVNPKNNEVYDSYEYDPTKKYYRPKGYHGGVKYTYDKASFVVSYGNRGKLRKYPKNYTKGVKDSQFITTGVAYDFTDKLAASLTYLYSWNRNTFNNYSIGADYKWVPGIKTYAEFTYVTAKQKYDYKSGKDINGKYRGGVVIVGAKFSL